MSHTWNQNKLINAQKPTLVILLIRKKISKHKVTIVLTSTAIHPHKLKTKYTTGKKAVLATSLIHEHKLR